MNTKQTAKVLTFADAACLVDFREIPNREVTSYPVVVPFHVLDYSSVLPQMSYEVSKVYSTFVVVYQHKKDAPFLAAFPNYRSLMEFDDYVELLNRIVERMGRHLVFQPLGTASIAFNEALMASIPFYVKLQSLDTLPDAAQELADNKAAVPVDSMPLASKKSQHTAVKNVAKAAAKARAAHAAAHGTPVVTDTDEVVDALQQQIVDTKLDLLRETAPLPYSSN
jgi:hypothetical protein